MEFQKGEGIIPNIDVPKSNFCPLSLLREGSSAELKMQLSFQTPAGIDEFNVTGRGTRLANEALGNDPDADESEQKLNDWLTNRSSEIDLKLRDLYNLPADAPNKDVINALKNDGSEGGRFCVLSQQMGPYLDLSGDENSGNQTYDSIYDGVVHDLLSADLSQKHKQRKP